MVFISFLNYAAAVPKGSFHKRVCEFLTNFPLFKTEICSWESQNTIRPRQNLLEHLFTMHFDNTSPVRTFQVSFHGMPLIAVIQAPRGNGAPTQRPTLHAHK